uniref:Cilia and flagella associated protein 92 (putative) n=1 Tax=Apteryx owenii TaxID=8824 RepID=A0A8B9QBU1_APTOW
MARQEYGTSEAVDEEEMTGLDTICSKNTFETESLEVLEDGGHLTPESESSRPYLSEKDSVELAASHTVTCTFTVSLAVPIVVPSKYLTQTSDVAEVQRNSIQGDKYAAIPRMRRYYHIEYFLLPDDTVPRKLDLVLFGMIAKLFAESDSKTITPWFENDQIWVSWNHSIDINVTNEYLMKLRDHKITLKLWDSKDKVSSKAKISQPKIFSSQVEDVDAVGKPNANKHIMYLEIEWNLVCISVFSEQPPYILATGRQEKGLKALLPEVAVFQRSLNREALVLLPKLLTSCAGPVFWEFQQASVALIFSSKDTLFYSTQGEYFILGSSARFEVNLSNPSDFHLQTNRNIVSEWLLKDTRKRGS